MRRKPDESVRITTAASSRSDEINGRQRRYLISMGIRTVCFLAAVFSIGHWFAWVFVVAAVVLPYIAVIAANAGAQPDIGDDEFAYRPDLHAIGPFPEQQPLDPTAEASPPPSREETPMAGRAAPDAGSQAHASPAAEDRMTCSAKGCQLPARWALLWNNPKLHDPDRRKAWMACEEHRGPLSEFLGARGFLREVRDL